MSSHTGDGAAESCWQRCCRVMLAIALQLNVVLVVIRLRSPRARSIEVLSQCEEVRLACQSLMIFMLAHSRVIAVKIL
jgi:hypothetical protein